LVLAINFLVVAVMALLWFLAPHMLLFIGLSVPVGIAYTLTLFIARARPFPSLAHSCAILAVCAYALLPVTDWPHRITYPFVRIELDRARAMVLVGHALPRDTRIGVLTVRDAYAMPNGAVILYLAQGGNAFVSPPSAGSQLEPWWTVRLSPTWAFITTD
jgi:hypothetical protein